MQQWENQDFHLHDDHANGQKYPRNHLPVVEMTIFDLHKKLYSESKSLTSSHYVRTSQTDRTVRENLKMTLTPGKIKHFVIFTILNFKIKIVWSNQFIIHAKLIFNLISKCTVTVVHNVVNDPWSGHAGRAMADGSAGFSGQDLFKAAEAIS